MKYKTMLSDLENIISSANNLLNRLNQTESNVKTDLVPKTQEDLDEFLQNELENSELSSFGDTLSRFAYDTANTNITMDLESVQEPRKPFPRADATLEKEVLGSLILNTDARYLSINELIQIEYPKNKSRGFNVDDNGVALEVGTIIFDETLYPKCFTEVAEKEAYNKTVNTPSFVWIDLGFLDEFRKEFDSEAKLMRMYDVDHWNQLIDSRIQEINKEQQKEATR